MSGRAQRGQAIVLIALMLAVVVGMAALAIDGSRAYAVRRDLQAAVDAAALAAADNLQHTSSYPSAERAAIASFEVNLRIYGSPCSPAYGSPGAGSFTVTCNYADGTTLTQVVSALGPRGSQFQLSASRTLSLQFARILTDGTSPTVVATSAGRVNNLLYAPTIAALSQAGCGGAPGAAISVTSGGTLTVIGDMVSSGAIVLAGSADVTGDVYARCQSSIAGVTTDCYPNGSTPPCTFPNVAGATRSGYDFVDPNYPPPAVVGGSQVAPGSTVVLPAGTYAADPNFGGGLCYFLAGGVYTWQGGFTNSGSFVSNELKSPDEPKFSDNTAPANHQLWNADGVNCAGSFQLSAMGGPNPITEGAWSIEVTSVRTAVYNGNPYTRESAPSYCHTVTIGDTQVIQLQISNVPGATSYNVYAAPPTNGCSGPFGLAGNVRVVGPVQNNNTGGCPAYTGTGCSLGHETATLDSTLIGATFAPNAFAPPGSMGAYPPSGETAPLRSNLPNENPNRDTPPAGDRANENQCDTLAGALQGCPAPVTPGAVAFILPSGACLNASTRGDNYFFSGYQYNWMALYEPGRGNPPPNTCSNTLAAATDSAFIGLIYMPSAGLSVQKASTFRTDEVGGVIAYTLTFGGQLPTILGDPAEYGPVPPAAKLVG
jgi:Flp pilus assembly protein TadG